MERDQESPRKGYSSKSYQWALAEGLLPWYLEREPFFQDNAPIHRSEETEAWLTEHHILHPEWPPHSPDMMPIEHCWKTLKEAFREQYPELAGARANIRNVELVKDALKGVWAGLDQVKIDKLIDSVKDRLAAVRKAKGSYTHY